MFLICNAAAITINQSNNETPGSRLSLQILVVLAQHVKVTLTSWFTARTVV